MILSVEGLEVSYGSGSLFRCGTLSAEEGKVIAVVGRNGAGKSTFLRCLLGLQKQSGGNVTVDGRDVREMSLAQRARIFSYVSTSPVDTAYLTVRDVVSMGCDGGWSGAVSGDMLKSVESAMDSVSVSEMASRNMTTLSDGERQRVMIARALAQGSPVMVLDEPTAFLDVPNRVSISSLLKSLSVGTGKLVIYSTHEIQLARRYADFFWLLDSGTVTQLPASDAVLPEDFSF